MRHEVRCTGTRCKLLSAITATLSPPTRALGVRQAAGAAALVTLRGLALRALACRA
jgi:hypothetical protein